MTTQDEEQRESSRKIRFGAGFPAGIGAAAVAIVILVLIATGVLMATGILAARPAQIAGGSLEVMVGDVSPSAEAPMVEYGTVAPRESKGDATASASGDTTSPPTPTSTRAPNATQAPAVVQTAAPTPTPVPPTPVPTPVPPATCKATVVDYGNAEFFKTGGASGLYAYGHTAIYNARPNFPVQTVLAAIKHPPLNSSTVPAYQVYGGTYDGLYIKQPHTVAPNLYWKITC